MSKPIPYGQGATFRHLTSCGNCSAYAAGDSHKPYGVDGLFPVQRTADVHQPFGTDKSVPYANSGVLQFIPLPQKDVTKAECMNAFPTKYPDKFQFNCLLRQADMHKIFIFFLTNLCSCVKIVPSKTGKDLFNEAFFNCGGYAEGFR